VLQYYDAQTDDVALTNAVMHSATLMGAELKLGAKVHHIQLRDKDSIVHYRQANHEFACRARVAVNAAGPWANTILKCVTPHQNSIPYDLIQGTHIILPGSLYAGSYYVEAPQDGRGVFIMPWEESTLLGTTERLHKNAPETIKPDEEEIEYLLKIIHHYFPQRKVAIGDILRTFAGARVLPSSRDNASDRSRETSLIVDRSPQPRLISIIGGKLTVYRATAQKSLQKIVSSLPHKSPLADTESIPLHPVDEFFCQPPELG
jgi:glycerol-3-phosphate dehydrogenase